MICCINEPPVDADVAAAGEAAEAELALWL